MYIYVYFRGKKYILPLSYTLTSPKKGLKEKQVSLKLFLGVETNFLLEPQLILIYISGEKYIQPHTKDT